MSDTLENLWEEYRRLAHAMQSGVAAWMNYHDASETSRETSPKHLRVGVNSALSDIRAVARLLIAKGVFTELEYAEAVRDGMKREVDSYERMLSERAGIEIHLG